jgi:hypothetical protein
MSERNESQGVEYHDFKTSRLHFEAAGYFYFPAILRARFGLAGSSIGSGVDGSSGAGSASGCSAGAGGGAGAAVPFICAKYSFTLTSL